MRKFRFLTAATALLLSTGAYAQYFGTPFYTEGFESASDFANWTVNTTIAPTDDESKVWHLVSETGFEDVDANSTQSVALCVNQGDRMVTTITSPVIDAAGKEALYACVFGKQAFTQNMAWRQTPLFFEAKLTDASDWEVLYASPDNEDTYSTEGWNWQEVRKALPSKYDGKKFQLRLRMQCDAEDGAQGYGLSEFCFDGVYVAENYDCEAAVTAVAPNANLVAQSPSTVSVTVKNNARKDLSNFKIAYNVNGEADVEQTVTDVIAPGEEKVFTFTRLADFTEYGKAYTLTAKVIADNDPVADNNTVTAEFNNILAALPYKATEIKSRNDQDYWESISAVSDDNANWYIGQDRSRDDFYWTIQVYGNRERAAYLFTRPVVAVAGQKLTAAYLTSTVGTGDAPEFKVYLAKYEDRNDPSKYTLLKETTLGTRSDDKVNMEIPEDGVYTVVLYTKTFANGMSPYFKNFSLTETPAYDAAVVSVDSPSARVDEFSNEETVTVTVANTGLEVAEGIKLRLVVDNNNIATESLPALAVKEERQYTFQAKVDLTSGKSHNISVEIIWDKDQDALNNKASITTEADLVAPPYSVTMYSNDFDTHWSWTDNNEDGNTFGFEDVYGNLRLAYNINSDEIPTTDETLFSRTLRLSTGKTYKASGRVSIWNGTNKDYKVTFELYKVNGKNRTFVKTLSTEDSYYDANGNFIVGYDVPENGNYSFAYHITNDAMVNTKLAVQELTIEESGDVELILDRVSLPGTTVSGYSKLPYSVRVKNNGLKNIENSVNLKISSEKLGTINETLALSKPLEPGSSVILFPENPIVADFTADEYVTFEIVAEGDVVPSNNSYSTTFKYRAPADLPLRAASNDEAWLVFDNNKDGYSPSYYSYYEAFDMGTNNGDWVMSPAFNALKDTPYRISYEASIRNYAETGKIANIFAVNVADNSTVPVGTMIFDKVNTPGGYSNFPMESYMTLPADGVYVLVYEVDNHLETNGYASNYMGGTVTIEALEQAPDMQMLSITEPDEDKVYTAGELASVTATYKNNGSVTLNGANFTLKAGDKTYYSYVNGNIEPQAEGSVVFTDVDLYVPGDYELEATAELGVDAAPADNTVKRTVKSLPVIDVNVLSIDGPDNGPLTDQEHVVVSIKNDGHGALVNTPVTMMITNNKGGAPVTVNEIIEEAIEEGQTLQYTFSTASDFRLDATYTIAISINLAGDVNADNNTVVANIISTHEDMDAGVTAIVGPTQKRMTNEEYIVIKVKNFSNVDLFRVPVQAVVTKGDDQIASVNGIVTEIPAGQEVEYTFTTPVDIARGGTYTIEAKTSLPNDVDSDNDSFEGTIYAFIKDLGISRIINPAPAAVEGKQDIVVEIKNFGDVPMSNIPVAFKLGSNPQTDTYEGEILPGETVEFKFKSQYNFRANREYTLTAYTAHPEDENAENDELAQEIKPVSGINGVYANGAIAVRADKGMIVVNTEYADGIVEVYNASGLRMAAEQITDNVTALGVAPGVYMVKVMSVDAEAVAKVVVR